MKAPTIEVVFEKPTYKPLSELAGDRESCEKIFQHFTHGGEFEKVELGNDLLVLCGRYGLYSGTKTCSLIVSYSGKFLLIGESHDITPEHTIFTTVDFIRSLGYSA